MIKRIFPALLLCLVCQAAPAAQAADTPRQLEIPAGELAPALDALARQAGVELVYRTEQLKGLTTHGLKGHLSARQAVDRLLEGTKLTVRVDSTGAMLIGAPRRDGSTESGQASGVDMGSFQLARQDGNTAAVRKDEAAATDELTVTGTRETGIVNQGVIPREENQAVRYDIITREEIERSGVTTMPELMRWLTVNQESGTTSQRGFQAASAGLGATPANNGDQVNLRGLGNAQTAVMINGRRLYGSDSSLGPDISRIPLSAVERIEVLPSSGSAIYGSSSVGGVINIVMRQGYRGTEATAYVGGASEGGAGEYRFDLFHGLSFNEGRTHGAVSLNLQHFDELKRGDRDYDDRMLASASAPPGSAAYRDVILPLLLSRQGVIVTSSPLGLGIPSNPAARYAAIPAGSDGLGLVPASFNATANTAYPSTEHMSGLNLRQQSSSYAAMLNLEHALLGDALAVYTELTYRKDDMPLRYPAGGNVSVSFSAADPRNPFRTNVTSGFVGRAITVYRDPADLPDSSQDSVRTTLRGVLGLKGKWTPTADRTYNWALDASWDRNKSELEGRFSGFLLSYASQAGVYNIFRDLTGAAPLPETEAAKHRYDSVQLNEPTISAANLRVNGDLFHVWGGPAKFSLGSELRREQYLSSFAYPYVGEYAYLPGAPPLVPSVASDTDRQVHALYGEVQVPLVGEANRMPGLYSLDLSAGMRYEKYDDFRAAKPPLYALKWGITPDVALRASFAEGFQAPTVNNLRNVVTSFLQSGTGYTDPLRPGLVYPGYTMYSSGNPALSAETAETWDAGLILTPRALPGLSINASYFRLDKRGNISTLTLQQAIESFPELVVRGAPTADDIAANRPGAVTEFHNKPVNIARYFTDGIDVQLKYRLPARSWGQLTLLSAGTWTDRVFKQARPGQPEVSSLAIAAGAGSFTLKERINATAVWNRGAWSTSLTGSYTGKFETPTTTASARNPAGSGIDGDFLGGQWTLDAQADYTLADAGARSGSMRQWLGGTRWTVGILNLFDTEPDLWTNRLSAFTTPFIDPRQRFIYLQARKTF